MVLTLVIPLQVSVCIPVLRLSRQKKNVLFYCHFPDQLLTQRKTTLKKLYRAPIDWLEERTTGMADMVRRGWGLYLSPDCDSQIARQDYVTFTIVFFIPMEKCTLKQSG